ncbi:unnamed protein product [Gongylonema pulchrum]|uniref:t-SNARE coiled-coil homology domain-containing protein n=1 Tax=Gongylonema pulchrum TaxID=637853 RepID=A0A183E9T8_9BILA|nr:unnamed protein product [Gongylonema pulchrum]
MELSGQVQELSEASSQFISGERALEKLQRDQDSFVQRKVLGPDDLRFNKTHFEKENSWEPSIHFTDSQLLPSATSINIPERVVSVDTENTPPSVPQRSKDFLEESAELKKTPTNFSQGSSEPKMSTPNSLLLKNNVYGEMEYARHWELLPYFLGFDALKRFTYSSKELFRYCTSPKGLKLAFDSRRSLRDLTMNCISAIYPDPVGSHCGADFRAPNRTFDKLSAVGKEQPSLSSSAIARVLSVIVLITSCRILI